jgi:uncharacterized phiE125 gp8 family phage protein
MISALKMKVLEVSAEVITLEQARQHLKLDTYGSPEMNDEDELVTSLITAARERIENYLNIAIAFQTVQVVYDDFKNYMPLYGPISTLVSVDYEDELNAGITLDPSYYTIDEYSKVPALVLNYGYKWPKVYPGINKVSIRLDVGFTDGIPEDEVENENPCPKAIIQGMLLTIGHLFKNRESTTDLNLKDLPDGVVSLVYPYRVQLGV